MEKRKSSNKNLPKPKKIDPKRTTDEKRYPMGWNACLRQVKKNLNGNKF